MNPNPCTSCQYWSDKHAEVQAGMTYAKCLSSDSIYSGQMVPVMWTCDAFFAGPAVDLEQD